MSVKIKPVKKIKGIITVPGDKSISHRALLFGAIADGNTRIRGLSSSADVQSTKNCLIQSGVEIIDDHDDIIIHGKGLKSLQSSADALDCGNSGTTIRLISGILAGQNFTSKLVGDDSLSKRPMNRIIQPLSQMGAKIKSQPGGFAPLEIYGQSLNSIQYKSPVASAQIKSCILLAGLYADGRTSVNEPHLSRDHTERMLVDFGVELERNKLEISITTPQKLTGCDVFVPGDFSSAAFFIGAALITPNSYITIRNIGLNPTRTGLLEVLKNMGANIEIDYYDLKSSEPIGDIHVRTSELMGMDISSEMIPSLIDEVPILAVIASQAKGRTVLSGAKELRVKESDRLSAITKNLNKMGIILEEKEDGFIIEGPQQLNAAEVDSFHDHRIAMAFAIAGLVAKNETKILKPECVNISMPNFFEILEEIIVE